MHETSSSTTSISDDLSSQGGSERSLSILQNIKIGSFNIGSAMADILGSGVWNRIMIADLGYAATPVSLLLALNYFLAPLAIWTGQRSDHTNWRGYRRLPWIWGGRALMALGFLGLAFMTFELAETGNNLWWIGIFLAFTTISIGYICSGSTYTTLIYERAPEHQQGRAVGLAWTMLLGGYAFAGVLFARLLPEYTPEGLFLLFGTVVALMALLWFFSIWGEEQRRHPEEIARQTDPNQRNPQHFRKDFQAIWQKKNTRLFFFFIGVSFVSVFAQDQVLEPFGAQMFDLSVGETSRFAAFWGGTALLSSVGALILRRRIPIANYEFLARVGLWVLLGTFLLLTTAAFSSQEALLRPTLIIFGLGLGLWNIGTWGLMVSVSSAEHAGTYFGLWTMASLIFRGGGAVFGGIFRDTSLWLTDSLSIAYGGVFALEAMGIIVALYLLSRIPFEAKMPSRREVLIAVGAEG